GRQWPGFLVLARDVFPFDKAMEMIPLRVSATIEKHCRIIRRSSLAAYSKNNLRDLCSQCVLQPAI
ncbi:MAG: hypothetical protein WEB33_05930, partial [Bacteroidota bacterium]